MANDLRLLLQTIAGKGLIGLQRIGVAAKRMTLQRPEDTLLMLPDMDRLAKSNTEGRNIGVIAGG